MSTNKLETFIKENREKFDTAQPPHNIWKKIHIAINKPKDVGSTKKNK